jgi:predicted nucleic acid-binding protein
MIVVCDTSPINYLLLTGCVTVLEELYGRIIMPGSVFAELQEPGAPQAVKVWMANLPDWVEVRSATKVPALPLDPGEQEAIALAEELRADFLLLDERKGREIAVNRRLPVIGTLGVIERAGTLGLLDVSKAISRLAKTNFRASASLMTQIVERDAMRRRNEPEKQPRSDNL